MLTSTRIALGAALLTGLAMTPSPLLGVQGIESALVLGVVLPFFVAVAAARQVVAVRRRGVAVGAGLLLGRAVTMALGVLAVPAIVLALDALRVRNCAPGQGLLMMLLGPLPGVVLAAVVGVGFAAAVRRPALATTLAALAPAAGIAAAMERFYATPAIALYGHFFGWFPGALYDAALTLPAPLATFRAVTALLVAGLALLVVALWDPGRMRLRWRGARLAAVLGAAALIGAVVAATWYGPKLGHRTTAAFVAEQLGATARGRRCIVHAPREMDAGELARHVRDCDFRVAQAERTLGVHQPRRVTVFMFRSPDEKRQLMGAANTSIAKPWRDEVYVQALPWPHPILGHEVAHVVAGNAARGPWRVAGSLGGLWPNPGLIEGVAVAVAWAPRDELTPDQWAQAMVALHRMPSLDRLVGLGFLLEQGAMAYTAAGSFVHFLLETRGPEVVRRAYRTGDVAQAAGEPLPRLEQQWRAYLAQVPLPRGTLALARTRFTGRTLFSTVCPRTLARLRQQLGEDLAAGAPARVRATCTDLLDIDPTDPQARARLVGALARLGHTSRARDELARLEGPYDAPAPIVAQATEGLADAAWERGDAAQARALYQRLLALPQGEDQARNLEVKLLALEAGGVQARLVRELLLGDDGRGSSPPVAVHLARELDALRTDGLGEYLEARQLFFQRRFAMAIPLLRQALDQGLPTGRLRAEAERLLGTSLAGAGRWTEARAFWRQALGEAPNAADRLEARNWLTRVRYERR